MLELNAIHSVVPVVGMNESLEIRHFLGTGFFCGVDRPYLVTAKHVLRKWTRQHGIAILHNGDISAALAKILVESPYLDLAVLEVPGYEPPFVFPLGTGKIVFNEQIQSFDYGPTRTIAGRIHFSSATRIGNVTRCLDIAEGPSDAGHDSLEVSFPALAGASGSPILCPSQGFAVWGVVKENIGHHLLPAQIERGHCGDNMLTEETKLMLPQALAINVRHLNNLIDSLPENCRL
jgi:Trypsin-like peptidase domain